jgi:hypothetical protein
MQVKLLLTLMILKERIQNIELTHHKTIKLLMEGV